MLIIPAIDLHQGACVRLHQGRLEAATIYHHDPVEMAQTWAACGAKRLHLVDLDGAFQGKPTHMEIVKEMVQNLTIPVEIGGGIRGLETIAAYLEAGVAYVILGSVAIEDPQLVKEACRLYPGQIIVGIDAKDGRVAIKGWVDVVAKTALELAGELADLGVREIIYTDISRDGTLAGPNLEALKEMAQKSGLEVIASGGIANMADLLAIRDLKLTAISGIITGKALYDQKLDLREAIRIIEGVA